MGNLQCGAFCAGDDEGDESLNIGLDTKNITEEFQYHDKHLKEKKLKLDKYDQCFREIAYPMNYL